MHLVELVDLATAALKLEQLDHSSVDRDRLLTALYLVVPVTDVDGVSLHLVLSNDYKHVSTRTGGRQARRTHDEVPLSDLGVTDLLLERVVRVVSLGEDASIPELLSDLGRVVFLQGC